MAGYRRSYKKRVYKKKPKPQKAWYDRSVGTPKSIAMAAWKGVQYIKGLVNSERFHTYYDLSSGAAVNNSTGLVYLQRW